MHRSTNKCAVGVSEASQVPRARRPPSIARRRTQEMTIQSIVVVIDRMGRPFALQPNTHHAQPATARRGRGRLSHSMEKASPRRAPRRPNQEEEVHNDERTRNAKRTRRFAKWLCRLIGLKRATVDSKRLASFRVSPPPVLGGQPIDASISGFWPWGTAFEDRWKGGWCPESIWVERPPRPAIRTVTHSISSRSDAAAAPRATFGPKRRTTRPGPGFGLDRVPGMGVRSTLLRSSK